MNWIMPSDYRTFHEILAQICSAHHSECKSRRHFRSIFVNLKLVNAGLKSGYLWDKSPFLSSRALLEFVRKVNKTGITCDLRVLEINGDLIVCNIAVLSKLLFRPWDFFVFFDCKQDGIDLDDESQRLLNRTLNELQTLVGGCQVDQLTSIAVEDWRVPTLYGVSLGFPTVMWLGSENRHVLDFTQMINVKVNAKFKDFHPVELYSFSFPPTEATVRHVDDWFSRLNALRVDGVSLQIVKTTVKSSSVIP